MKSDHIYYRTFITSSNENPVGIIIACHPIQSSYKSDHVYHFRHRRRTNRPRCWTLAVEWVQSKLLVLSMNIPLLLHATAVYIVYRTAFQLRIVCLYLLIWLKIAYISWNSLTISLSLSVSLWVCVWDRIEYFDSNRIHTRRPYSSILLIRTNIRKHYYYFIVKYGR